MSDMWYNDFLLVMLLIVFIALIVSAILVGTRTKRTEEPTETETEEPKPTIDPEPVSNEPEKPRNGVYESLYKQVPSEPVSPMEPISIEETSPIQITETTSETIDTHPEQVSEMEESSEVDDPPMTVDLETKPVRFIDLITPIEHDPEEVSDEANDYSEPTLLIDSPKPEELKEAEDEPVHAYEPPVVEEPHTEPVQEPLYEFEPQLQEDTEDEEPQREYDPPMLDETEEIIEEPKITYEAPPIMIEPEVSREAPVVYEYRTVSESETEDDKPLDETVGTNLGVETCPHCNEKVPATLYCISCGKSLEK
ncbi:MAG: hypothetical protein NWE89_06350 [Candidatus Bathyarchaeota archaeon]|nr:hypothetical protein [Candidatus Bathyarchaeota archaeon]